MNSSQVSRRISQLEERLQKLSRDMPYPEIGEMTKEELETYLDWAENKSGRRRAKADLKILAIFDAAKTRLLKRLGK